MIQFFRDRLPRPFRIRPAESWDGARDEVRRWLEDARETLRGVPRFQEKTITFRGGDTNVDVDFPFRPGVLVVGRVEGAVSPGSAVTATATASGGTSSKLWEWNGTDTSQFDATTPNFSGTTSGSPITSPTISVVADATVPGGNILRATGTGTPAGYAVAHWLVKASESTLTHPKRYRWEWEIRATLPTYSGGITFFGDEADDSYYAWEFMGTNGSRHRVDQGTVVNFMGGGTGAGLVPNANDASGWAELWGEIPAAADPRFSVRGMGSASAGISGAHLSDSGSSDGAWQTSGTAVPNAWHGKDGDRWGICLQANSSGSPGNLDIARLALYEVGTDGGGASAEASASSEPPGLSVDWIPISSPIRGARIRAISGLTSGTDYKITLFAVGD